MKQVNASSQNLIERIKVNGYCSGCGLCESIATKDFLKIEFSKSGYLRPEIKKTIPTAELDEISKVCPGINIQHHHPQSSYDTIWGPNKQISTGYAVDESVRYHGSSGGVVSALAIFLIQSGKVSFVAQNAVSKHNPLLNELQLSKTVEDVIHAAGSRYAPSAPLKQIKQLFTMGEKFAFIGKPCDVAALRNYLHEHPELKQQVPYMISFMCAGIPSQKATDAILTEFSVAPDNVKKMRYRGEGWPGKAKVETHDGQVHEMDYATSWGSILNKHLQFRCKICPDGTGEFADIVCADAWYGESGYPEFEEQAGRSLVIARTTQGEDLINEAVNAQNINIESLAVDEVAKMQPYQAHRKKVVLARLMASLIANKFIPKYKNLHLMKASLQISFLEWLRNAWGTYKRINKDVT